MRAITPQKRLWINNFRKDFPNYMAYISALRQWEINPTDKEKISLKIKELDAKINYFERLTR